MWCFIEKSSLKHVSFDVHFAVKWSFLKQLQHNFFSFTKWNFQLASTLCSWDTWKICDFWSTLSNFFDTFSEWFHLFYFVYQSLLHWRRFSCYYFLYNFWWCNHPLVGSSAWLILVVDTDNFECWFCHRAMRFDSPTARKFKQCSPHLL